MTGLDTALADVEHLLLVHFYVFLRVAPVVGLFPGLGEVSVPIRLKLILAVAVTVVIAPACAPFLPVPDERQPPLIRMIFCETLVGLALGIGFRLFLLALQTAGSIAAQSTSLSQILGNTGAVPLPALGHLLVIGGLALAMTLGLHVQLTRMLILTYGIFPPAILPDAASLSAWGARQVAGAFALAFTLSAPFVITSLLYNLTLGAINRAMPQLMVIFVGAPIITLGGIVLLFMIAPTMLTLWAEALGAFLSNPLEHRP